MLGLFLLPVFSTEDIHENIRKTGIAVHHIFEPLILTKGIHIGIDRNSLCPCLVVMGDPTIPILFPDGIDQDKSSPGQAKLRHHLMYRFIAEGVVLIVTGNRSLDFILAGNVQLVGLTILFQITLPFCNFPGVGVHLHSGICLVGRKQFIGLVLNERYQHIQRVAGAFTVVLVNGIQGFFQRQ